LQVGGSSRFRIRKDGLTTVSGFMNTAGFRSTSDGGFYITDSTSPGAGGNDIALVRDAANILAQRNGVNAQTFRLYNTYTDASNYERGELSWSANNFTVGTAQAGTGLQRRLTLSGAGDIVLSTGNSQRWNIAGAGHFLAAADNTYDIGASGASRPRALYLSSSVYVPYLNTTSSAGAVRAFWYSAVSDVMSLGKSTGGLGGSLELTEDTAPAAPSTNSVRIYAEDNGSGKTRLMARFATGAAVQIAIEP